MSIVSEERPPEGELPRVKARLPFEKPRSLGGGSFRQTSLYVYGALVVALLGVAAYMALIAHRPLDSAWVAAPAIGALWFGLRLFMIWGSKD